MPELTAEQLAQQALNFGLIDSNQLHQVWSELGSQNVDAGTFLSMMLRHGFLTNYQVERLTNGDRTGYFYGNYKVLYVVGAGTFARVFRAVHKETGQVAAVKVLRARFSDNPSTYQQFVQEGKLGCTLKHPNIVPMYDVYSKGRMHFMAMEFVEGQNLREFVKMRKKFDPLEATRFMADTCSGLAYAAEQGLYHRDLKLSNVLISSQGRAKLVDFGMADMAEHMVGHSHASEVDQNTARTVDYAALERITHVTRNDPRSDIFFVGCMYYHLLTGHSPLFETRDRAKRMSSHRFLNIKPLHEHDADIPASVTMVCNRSMSLDADKRYQTMVEMLSDLRQTIQRLESGETGTSESEGSEPTVQPAGAVPQQKYTVMVVDASAQMQNVFRDGFKKAGYRVLVMSDPKRAVQRLHDEPDLVDFVIFNAQLLGNKAVRAFNELTEDLNTAKIPALLLLDDNQKAWAKKSKAAMHRLVIGMPVTMRGLRITMSRILEKREALAKAEGDSETGGQSAE